MKLSEAQKKVLRYMRRFHETILLGPGTVGMDALASEESRRFRKPQAFARVGGKVLNALKKKSLVEYVVDRCLLDNRHDYWGWRLTLRGRRAAEELKGQEDG